MPRIKDKLNHRFKFNRNGWKIYVKRAVFECTKIPVRQEAQDTLE